MVQISTKLKKIILQSIVLSIATARPGTVRVINHTRIVLSITTARPGTVRVINHTRIVLSIATARPGTVQ
jgi:hypothetical protein